MELIILRAIYSLKMFHWYWIPPAKTIGMGITSKCCLKVNTLLNSVVKKSFQLWSHHHHLHRLKVIIPVDFHELHPLKICFHHLQVKIQIVHQQLKKIIVIINLSSLTKNVEGKHILKLNKREEMQLNMRYRDDADRRAEGMTLFNIQKVIQEGRGWPLSGVSTTESIWEYRWEVKVEVCRCSARRQLLYWR